MTFVSFTTDNCFVLEGFSSFLIRNEKKKEGKLIEVTSQDYLITIQWSYGDDVHILFMESNFL